MPPSRAIQAGFGRLYTPPTQAATATPLPWSPPPLNPRFSAPALSRESKRTSSRSPAVGRRAVGDDPPIVHERPAYPPAIPEVNRLRAVAATGKVGRFEVVYGELRRAKGR